VIFEERGNVPGFHDLSGVTKPKKLRGSNGIHRPGR
jgi:hypothetical protein